MSAVLKSNITASRNPKQIIPIMSSTDGSLSSDTDSDYERLSPVPSHGQIPSAPAPATHGKRNATSHLVPAKEPEIEGVVNLYRQDCPGGFCLPRWSEYSTPAEEEELL